MKITRICAKNFLGHTDLDLEITDNLLVISGPNAVGKSTIRDAIRFAVAGDSCRSMDLKKDYKNLLTQNTKKGEVTVTIAPPTGDDVATIYSRVLPSGQSIGTATENETAKYVIDADKFLTLDLKERRAFLYKLMGVSTTPREIAEKLLKKGVAEEYVQRVVPLLRSGFPAAHKEAEEHRREAKASWRAITGETYGSDKAEGWEPEVENINPLATETQLQEMDAEITSIDDKIKSLSEQIGSALTAQQTILDNEKKIEDAQAACADESNLEKALKASTATLKKLRSEHDALALRMKEQQDPGGYEFTCPGCDTAGRIFIDNGVAVFYDAEVKHEPPTEEEVEHFSQLQRLISEEEERSSSLNKKLNKIINNKNMIAVYEEDLRRAKENAVDPDALTETRAKFKERLEVIKVERDELKAKDDAYAQAEEKRLKAAEYHQEVIQWDIAVSALAPDGIPGDLLKSAFGPINEFIKIHAATTGWICPVIDSDMNVTADGRAYSLLSHSEQWRASAMIAAAISDLSGMDFLVLDELDVLEPAARPVALEWLYDLSKGGIQVITMATLKEPVKPMDGLQSVWLGE